MTSNVSLPLPPSILSPATKLFAVLMMSSPSPVCMSFIPPVIVMASLPDPPRMVLVPVPIVRVRLAEAAVPFTLVILVGNVPRAIVPVPNNSKPVNAPPEFEITTKLVLSDVIFAEDTLVPAISINTF